MSNGLCKPKIIFFNSKFVSEKGVWIKRVEQFWAFIV